MKHPARILAGTALGLLMVSAPSFADSLAPNPAPLLLAQADDAELRKKLEEEEAAKSEASEEEASDEGESPAEEAAPAAEPVDPVDEAPAEETAEPEPEPAEEAAPVEKAAPAEEDASAESAEDAAPAAEPEDPVDEATTEETVAPEPEPAEEAPAEAEAQPETEADEVDEAPAATEAQPSTTEAEADGEIKVAPEAPAGDDAAAPAGEDATDGAEADAPADEAPPAGEAVTAEPQDTGGDDTLPENAAPVLDSAKEAPASERDNRRAGRPERTRTEEAAEAEAEDAAPPPTSDEDAQAPEIREQEIQSITATEGRRVDRDEVRRERRKRPEGAEVVRESEGRVIFEFNNQIFVQSNDLPRLSRDARDVYYEELPRGLVRETIVRPNGVQIVTIRNRHGEIVRRSRISPDGRETVLTYLREDRWDRQREWRDPGEDLPPLRLRIPVREYILDAGQVDDADTYYAFLDQPPVEQARRLYSVDEVKRSARLRDTVRRVDLDTITFATGSAEIARSEVEELEAIASAMLRLLDENPAETFLIEGHTDAVGSDISNLALSDARAESAADVLTRVYGIPPENLVTQGYGERYLKVSTEGPSRENRRVAIRRITPLVAPVASTR